MFGQQPQQQYGYPQQGYGYQPQQRQPAQLSSLGELLAGNSAKAYFGANSQPGDTVTGVIEKIETTQVNDFQTKQPAFWNDGRPKEQIHVIIQTQLRDPSVEDDDGRRSLWVKGWGIQLKAFREACMQAGVKTPKPGDTITETYIGLGERGNAPQPPKVFSFRIEPPGKCDCLVEITRNEFFQRNLLVDCFHQIIRYFFFFFLCRRFIIVFPRIAVFYKWRI